MTLPLSGPQASRQIIALAWVADALIVASCNSQPAQVPDRHMQDRGCCSRHTLIITPPALCVCMLVCGMLLQDCLRKHPEVLEDLQSDKAGSSSSLQLS